MLASCGAHCNPSSDTMSYSVLRLYDRLAPKPAGRWLFDRTYLQALRGRDAGQALAGQGRGCRQDFCLAKSDDAAMRAPDCVPKGLRRNRHSLRPTPWP